MTTAELRRSFLMLQERCLGGKSAGRQPFGNKVKTNDENSYTQTVRNDKWSDVGRSDILTRQRIGA